jgi:hypothetical protein
VGVGIGDGVTMGATQAITCIHVGAEDDARQQRDAHQDDVPREIAAYTRQVAVGEGPPPSG